MDSQRFDRIIKSLTRSRSRRHALQAFGGALVGATLFAKATSEGVLAASCCAERRRTCRATCGNAPYKNRVVFSCDRDTCPAHTCTCLAT